MSFPNWHNPKWLTHKMMHASQFSMHSGYNIGKIARVKSTVIYGLCHLEPGPIPLTAWEDIDDRPSPYVASGSSLVKSYHRCTLARNQRANEEHSLRGGPISESVPPHTTKTSAYCQRVPFTSKQTCVLASGLPYTCAFAIHRRWSVDGSRTCHLL